MSQKMATILEEMSPEKREIFEDILKMVRGDPEPSEETEKDSGTEVGSEEDYEEEESGEVFDEDSIPDKDPKKTQRFNRKFLRELKKGAKEFNHGKVQFVNDGVFLTKITNKAFKFNTEFLASKSKYFENFIEKNKSRSYRAKIMADELEWLNGLPVYTIDESPFVLDKILKYIYGDKRCYKFNDYKLATRVMYAAEVYAFEDYKLFKHDFYRPEAYGLREYSMKLKKLLMDFKGQFTLNKYIAPDNKLHIKIQEIKNTKTLDWDETFPRTESEMKAMIRAALPSENPVEVMFYAFKYYLGTATNYYMHWEMYPLEEFVELVPWDEIEDLGVLTGRKHWFPFFKEKTWDKIIRLCEKGKKEREEDAAFDLKELEKQLENCKK